MKLEEAARANRRLGALGFALGALVAAMGMDWRSVRADAAPPERFVLQVAIERYRWAPALHGPRADVRDLRDVLIRRYRFRPGDFRTLEDSAATRDRIIAAIREHLVDNARRHPGALCVLHFSGHGSRTRDLDREPWEPDGWDETLVPWDGRDPDGLQPDISDDELAVLFSDLARYTSRAVLIFDACNAGTITRGFMGARLMNGLPPPARVGTASPSTTPRIDESVFGVALFSSPPNQPSWVEDIGGERRSVFTYQLARALERASSRTSYAQVLERVARAIRARFGEQMPFGEGALDQPVLAGEAPDNDADLGVRTEGSGLLRVDAGLLQGVTLGSTIAIRGPRASRTEADGGVLTEGIVTMLGPSDCRVRVDPAITVPEGARAFLRSTGVGYQPLRIQWAVPAGAFPAAAALRNALVERFRGDPLVEIAVAPDSGGSSPLLGAIVWGEPSGPREGCEAHASPPPGLALLLRGGEVGLGRVFPSPDATTADSLEGVLRRVALAENLRVLDGGSDTLANEVSFALLVVRRGTSVVDTLREHAGLQTLAPGDSARVFVVNRSMRRVSVALLHVGPGRTSGVLFPDEPTGVVIGPEETLVDAAWLRVDPPCGIEHLKLLVTDHPVDLGALFEPVRTRGPALDVVGGSGSLGRLLWAAGHSLRRGSAVDLVKWAVRDLIVSIEAP